MSESIEHLISTALVFFFIVLFLILSIILLFLILAKSCLL